MSFFKELKRRHVFKVTIAYVVVAWLILQVADVILGNIGAPEWVFKVTLLFLCIGLPVIVMFAWAFDMTPDGLKRTESLGQAVTEKTSVKTKKEHSKKERGKKQSHQHGTQDVRSLRTHALIKNHDQDRADNVPHSKR